MKMVELSEIVINEMSKETNNASVLLYHLSNRCTKAKNICRKNPDETFFFLEELSCALELLSRSLEVQSNNLDECLIDETESQAA